MSAAAKADGIDTGNQALLVSKLSPPLLRHVLDRPRLMRQSVLDEKSGLINICAGAGFGKTTLMAQIALAFTGNYVWYQIDHLDRDPAVFLRHLVAGIANTCGLDDSRAQARLSESTDFTQESASVIALIMEELRESSNTPLLICLDDLHVLDGVGYIQPFFDYLTQYFADGVSVIIASRSERDVNFGRLRSQGAVCELSECDLQFSYEELLDLMSSWNLDSTTATVEQVHKTTEGWAAGVVLTESYLRKGHDVPELFAHRRMQQDLYEYLAEEVLQSQSEEMRDFLMNAALVDPIDPAICRNALETPHSSRMLDLIERDNLFTTRLENSDSFRFHPLFREFLLERFRIEYGTETINHARVKYAEAFIQAGSERQAVEQLLLADRQKEAVALMEQIGEHMLDQAEYETLERWIESLDDSFLTISIKIMRAILQMKDGKYLQAIRGLAPVVDRQHSKNMQQMCKLKTTLAECLGEVGRSEEAIDLLLPLLKKKLKPKSRNDVLFRLSVLYWTTYDYDGIQACIEIADSHPGSACSEQWPTLMSIMISLRQGEFFKAYSLLAERLDVTKLNESQRNIRLNNMASSQMLMGNYPDAKLLAEQCIKRIEKQCENKLLPVVQDTLASIDIACGDKEAGKQKLRRVLAEITKGQRNRNDQDAVMICHLGTLARRQGDYISALELHEKCLSLAESMNEVYEACIGRVNIAADLVRLSRFDEANELFFVAMKEARKHRLLYVQTHVDFHRAWAAHALEETNEILENISSTLSRAKKYHHNHFILQEGLISLPLFSFALKNRIEPGYVFTILERMGEKSLNIIEPFLNHSDPIIRENITVHLMKIGGTGSLTLLRRMRYDEDDKVRDLVRSSLTQLRRDLKSPSGLLTAREFEVLRWVSTGQSNKQIASELFISERTVKTHVARIFRKLGFINRLDAALFYRQFEKNTTFDD